jgi:predicted  nucleic acid-binding Zn-ribbon protein
MNESEETLNLENSAVLKAIADLSTKFGNLENRFGNLENRFDTLEKTVNIQFEVIREGISYNSAKFDRLEAKIYDARSDISNLRADIK